MHAPASVCAGQRSGLTWYWSSREHSLVRCIESLGDTTQISTRGLAGDTAHRWYAAREQQTICLGHALAPQLLNRFKLFVDAGVLVRRNWCICTRC